MDDFIILVIHQNCMISVCETLTTIAEINRNVKNDLNLMPYLAMFSIITIV